MTTDHSLRTESLTVGYGKRIVIDELTLGFPAGATTAIIGPNGCGKSTLLKSMSRILRPSSGRVLIDDKPLHQVNAKRLARIVGLLPQSPTAPEGITVAELVGQGRHPHQSIVSRWSAVDEAAVADALTDTGTTGLADRAIDELSGGQRQKVWIAMILAQQPSILLLDEPTTFLDVSHQIEVLDLLTDRNRLHGTTVIMVLHDLNLAARYADHLVLMSDGACEAAGPPSQVFTAKAITRVFGLPNQVSRDPISKKPMMIPVGRHHSPGASRQDRSDAGNEQPSTRNA
ncbi:ABC transporter ATP-binding protein [Gordonia sp. (in: high G+C Gram-positive bacteria)]|uniref:ABC transporter ATP-binding protein n=1 Tax=Gordonia sp. (in: high G+C Gram-positive bacteria) TaxID=84139 RepID=UPI003F9C1B3E